MRLVTLTCRMRHVALWWHRLGLVFIWPLAWPSPHIPWRSVTWPWQSGGSLVVRFGPLLLIWRGRP